ncbi:MAG: RNA methyltransferase [Bacteroidales bacterium]|nr:RNA methyltransferase [Bacteroidales bacterium]MCF6341541.1 RNA methyltransferase [Bacteroidales bacterium]
MLSKAKIKHIQSLRLGKFRRLHNQFIAEGSTNVLDFLKSNLKTLEVFATAEWKQRFTKEVRGILVTEASTKELERISALKTAAEVLAVVEMPAAQEIVWSQLAGISLMLDDIKDPGNLGTIIRTADWFGISQLICSEETVDAYNPKVVQASMGSLARVEVHYKELEEILKEKPATLPVYGAVLNGISIREVEKPEKAIVLIGSEAHGISGKLLKYIDEKITIPASSGGGAESLNASIATAIICYEFSI